MKNELNFVKETCICHCHNNHNGMDGINGSPNCKCLPACIHCRPKPVYGLKNEGDIDKLTKGVKIIHTDVIFIDLDMHGNLGLFVNALERVNKTYPNRKILFAWTTEKNEAIFVLEP